MVPWLVTSIYVNGNGQYLYYLASSQQWRIHYDYTEFGAGGNLKTLGGNYTFQGIPPPTKSGPEKRKSLKPVWNLYETRAKPGWDRLKPGWNLYECVWSISWLWPIKAFCAAKVAKIIQNVSHAIVFTMFSDNLIFSILEIVYPHKNHPKSF